jgi:hypothetical protein
MARISAKIRKRSARGKKAKIPLDRFLEKRRRGRPAKVRPPEIRGRADNNRVIFNQVWKRLWPLLSKVQAEADVVKAFQEGANPYAQQFVPSWSNLVLEILHDRKFPKRRQAQINFLADSLAGLGRIAPRTSRDICTDERAKAKRAHHIIRYEFYVECSCGYKGKSRNHACQKCRTSIDFGFASIFGPSLT